MGSGKTTVLGEASDLLGAAGVPHAAIDLDWLAMARLPRGVVADRLMFQNLAAVWPNYAALGVERLLIARAVESREQRLQFLAAIPHAEVVIGRLTASLSTMQQRVRLRERGLLQQTLVARVAELEAILDRAAVEDFTVENDNRSVTEVARDVLTRAGWL